MSNEKEKNVSQTKPSNSSSSSGSPSSSNINFQFEGDIPEEEKVLLNKLGLSIDSSHIVAGKYLEENSTIKSRIKN